MTAGFRLPPSRAEWRLAAVLLAVLLGALAVHAARNLPDPWLWYDEAVQFWTARGIDPFRSPGDPPRGLLGVVRINGRANLDPGGFSVLLHAWMAWSLDAAWLRALPLVFLLVGLCAMAGLGWAWRRRPLFAVVGVMLPLADPLLLYQHGVELRAYTMEFAGIALGCLWLHRLRAGAGPIGFALAGVTLAAFMSSRYSYSLFVAAAGLALLPAVRPGAGDDRDRRRRHLLALAVPVGAGVLGLALALWVQRGRITHQGGALLDYMSSVTAAGKPWSQLVRAAVRNLLAPVTFPVTLAAVLALVPSRWRARAGRWWPGLGVAPESGLLCRVALGVLVLTVLVWRWHPWEIRYKWSLYLHGLSAVLALRFLADVLEWAEAQGWWGRRARLAGAAAATMAAVALAPGVSGARRPEPTDITGALRQLSHTPLGAGSVAVGTHAYPGLRYLCEHGPFVGRLPYPAAFRLPSWGGPRPLIGPETRYMVALEPADLLAQLHPGASFRAAPGWPRHLFAVEPASSAATAPRTTVPVPGAVPAPAPVSP